MKVAKLLYLRKTKVMNFVCVCVLGEFQSPNHDPRIYFIVRDIKLSIHQKHPLLQIEREV